NPCRRCRNRPRRRPDSATQGTSGRTLWPPPFRPRRSRRRPIDESCSTLLLRIRLLSRTLRPPLRGPPSQRSEEPQAQATLTRRPTCTLKQQVARFNTKFLRIQRTRRPGPHSRSGGGTRNGLHGTAGRRTDTDALFWRVLGVTVVPASKPVVK